MTEHTPTPWYHRQSGEFTRMGDPLDWIADSPERGQHRKIIVSRDSCYCAADYAFIVKAVNNHDALVKALEEISELPDVRSDEASSIARRALVSSPSGSGK